MNIYIKYWHQILKNEIFSDRFPRPPSRWSSSQERVTTSSRPPVTETWGGGSEAGAIPNTWKWFSGENISKYLVFMFGFVPPCSQGRRQWFYKELQSHETVGCALLQQRIFFEGNILFWFVLWSDIRGEIVSFQNLLMQHIDSEAEDLIHPNRGSDDGVVLGKLGWILCHLSRLSGRNLGRIFCETELIKLKCPQSQCQSVHHWHCYQFKFSRFLSAQMDNWQFQRFSAMTWNALGIEIISAVFCVNMFLKWTILKIFW